MTDKDRHKIISELMFEIYTYSFYLMPLFYDIMKYFFNFCYIFEQIKGKDLL